MQRSLYIVAYDVRHPARLRRILHVIKDYASGGQKSVFECYLSNTERKSLLAQAQQTLLLDIDSFAIIRLDQKRPVYLLGTAVAPSDQIYTYLG